MFFEVSEKLRCIKLTFIFDDTISCIAVSVPIASSLILDVSIFYILCPDSEKLLVRFNKEKALPVEAAFMGEQLAQLSQAGAGLSGSYADVIGQSAADAELDALNIRYEGELQAMGLLEQSQQSELSARVNRINARQAGRAGNTAAASTLLSGASNAYGYYRSPKG
jgi:hypothetical protein